MKPASDNGSWDPFATGTTIGYKRIMAKNDDTTSYGSGTQARYIRVKITDSKACPLISTVSVYLIKSILSKLEKDEKNI